MSFQVPMFQPEIDRPRRDPEMIRHLVHPKKFLIRQIVHEDPLSAQFAINAVAASNSPHHPFFCISGK
jgi:hypothetical protein